MPTGTHELQHLANQMKSVVRCELCGGKVDNKTGASAPSRNLRPMMLPLSDRGFSQSS